MMTSCDRKPVDLSLVLREFNAWEEHTTRMAEENKTLERELKSLKTELDMKKEQENYLISEMDGLRALIDVMQSTLAKRCDLEDDNRKMRNDIEDLKQEMKSNEKIHTDKISQMEDEVKNLREEHRITLGDVRSELQQEAHAEQEKAKKNFEEKCEEIKNLKEKLVTQENEKQTELMRLRMEYEAKLQKMQKQNVKMQQTTSQMSTANQDIFRQKLQHVKRESEREIASLKRTVSELQGKLDAQAQRSLTSGNSLSKRKRY